MSTKSTLLSFKNAHLYTEAFDDKNVHLELENVQFNLSNGRVSIEIPIEIWEVLRQKDTFQHYCNDWSDDYINDYVESEVSKRIGEKGMSRIFGVFIYGDTESCREDQVSRGIDYFTKKRSDEIDVINKIAANKIEAGIA